MGPAQVPVVRLRRFDEVSSKIAVPDEFLLIQGEEISDKYDKAFRQIAGL